MKTIIRATKNDIPLLIEIEKSVSGKKTYAPTLTEDEWLKEFGNGEVYLIKNDSENVGSIYFEWKNPDHAYLSGIVIRPEYQGQGFARIALEETLKMLADLKTIDLVTHPDNLPALTLYKSLGFEITEKLDNPYGDGEPRLRLVLKK